MPTKIRIVFMLSCNFFLVASHACFQPDSGLSQTSLPPISEKVGKIMVTMTIIVAIDPIIVFTSSIAS